MEPKTELDNQKKPKNEEDEEPEPMRRRVPVRVHDIIIIRGNIGTKDTVIESEVKELLRGATTFQELRHAAAVAEERLRGMGIFGSVNVRVYAGPPDLPGTANVVIEVSEPNNPLAKIWDDIRNASGLGVFLPRFEAFRHPFSAHISLLSQNWLNFSSYKVRDLGYSLSILSSGNHDLSRNLHWHSLSKLGGQPGHSLLSALKYSFRIYPGDSPLKPTRGFEFLSTTRICSVSLEPQSSLSFCFIHQGVGLNHTIPLEFCGADLKLRASAGVLFRLQSLYVQGFRARDLAEPRRVLRDIMDKGFWDLAFGASADLSFDLPLKVLRDAGIRGLVSASTSGLNSLTDIRVIRRRRFSLQEFKDSLEHDVGVGVIIPTHLFQMEVKYSHTLQHGPHQGRNGIEFYFSRQ